MVAWVEKRLQRDQVQEQALLNPEGKGKEPLDMDAVSDDGVRRIVILLRSPLDLLLPIDQWTERVLPP